MLLSFLVLAAQVAAVPLNPTRRDILPGILNLKRSQSTQLKGSLRTRQVPDGVKSLVGGLAFSTEVTIGNEQFQLIVDTGSSDTWVAGSDVQCVSVTTGAPVDKASCKFGKTFTVDSTFSQIPDMHINGSYGDGEWINGLVGYESVTLAGINIPNQEIAIVTEAAWNGDSLSSGILGLAYPGLSSSWVGTDPLTDKHQFESPYPTIMQRIADAKAPLKSENQFALAISRDVSKTGNGGLLILGEVPESVLTSPSVNAAGPVATATVEHSKYWSTSDSAPYSFYAIEVSGMVYKNSELNGAQYIIDSGNTLTWILPSDADAINNLFVPPADSNGNVACNAKPPPAVGFSIGGQTFNINPKDMIFKFADGTCVSAFQPCGHGCPYYVLGDPFLRNVLATFRYTDLEVQLQARELYTS